MFLQETFIILYHLRLSWTDKKGLKSVFARVLNEIAECWMMRDRESNVQSVFQVH